MPAEVQGPCLVQSYTAGTLAVCVNDVRRREWVDVGHLVDGDGEAVQHAGHAKNRFVCNLLFGQR